MAEITPPLIQRLTTTAAKPTPEPKLPGADLVNGYYRSVARDKVFEEHVNVINVSLELLSGLVSIFAKYREGPFVLSRGVHLEIDVILFE